MTRDEFEDIYEWSVLHSYMEDVEYYEFVPEYGTLYISESDLVSDIAEFIINNSFGIRDLQRIAIEDADPHASVWVANSIFSSIVCYYDDEFSDVKEDFEDWLESNNYFDDERECEDDTEMEGVPDDMLNALLYKA